MVKKKKEPHLNWEQWKEVVLAADRLAELAESREARVTEILTVLEQAEKAFPRSVDPVDSLKEFACRQLCRSLRMALEGMGQAGSA